MIKQILILSKVNSIAKVVIVLSVKQRGDIYLQTWHELVNTVNALSHKLISVWFAHFVIVMYLC